MKYCIPKKQLIVHLEELYSKEESRIDEYNTYVNKVNSENEQQSEQDKAVAIEKYRSLPEGWWKQFTRTEEVTSSDKLIFNETKVSDIFMQDLAEKYLEDLDDNLIVTIFPENLDFYPFSENCFGSKYYERINENIDTFIMVEWNKNIRGKLYSSNTHYTICYSNILEILVKKDKSDLKKLEKLITKIKNLPPYITEVTLEDNDIDLMNKFTNKEKDND